MTVLGSVLGEQLGGSTVPGDPSLSALVASRLLSGFRVVYFTGTDPNDASTYLRKPVEVGPDIRDVVIAEPFAESANVMVAVQARFLDGTKESSWRVLGGAVVVDPDTQAIPSTDEQARNDAAQAIELAASKNKVFYENIAPTSGMSAGDVWFNTDLTHVCPDPNCKGHGANASGVPLVGSYPHRGLYWTHRYNGTAWRDAQRTAQVIGSEAAFGFLVGDHISTNGLQLANYAEDASGNPTAGAKIFKAAAGQPPIKVSPSGIQIGKRKLSEAWFQQTFQAGQYVSFGSAGQNWCVQWNTNGCEKVYLDDYSVWGFYILIPKANVPDSPLFIATYGCNIGNWDQGCTYMGATDHGDGVNWRLTFKAHTISTAANLNLYGINYYQYVHLSCITGNFYTGEG